jgi:hypothetical protein
MLPGSTAMLPGSTVVLCIRRRKVRLKPFDLGQKVFTFHFPPLHMHAPKHTLFHILTDLALITYVRPTISRSSDQSFIPQDNRLDFYKFSFDWGLIWACFQATRNNRVKGLETDPITRTF